MNDDGVNREGNLQKREDNEIQIWIEERRFAYVIKY